MKLDERAERAAADLIERASRRPIPTVEQLTARDRPSRRPKVLAVAAAIAVVAATATVVTTRGDRDLERVQPPASVAVPDGVTPQVVEPAGLGVALQVPDGFASTGSTRGFDVTYVDGDESYVSVSRIATTDRMSPDAFIDLRRDLILENMRGVPGGAARTEVDGHDAVVIDGTWEGISFTEHDVDLGDGTWAIVAIGERQPVDHADVHAWIASTIEVRPTPLWSSPIDHPAPLAPPTGVAPRTWAPEGMGFTVDVPATWDDAPYLSGFDTGVSSTSGPATFVLASVEGTDADARAQELDGYGARVVETTDAVLDGHATHITRYRIPTGLEPRLASLDVEYLVDLGDGRYLVLTLGTQGGSPADLIEWIRSTIRITE